MSNRTQVSTVPVEGNTELPKFPSRRNQSPWAKEQRRLYQRAWAKRKKEKLLAMKLAASPQSNGKPAATTIKDLPLSHTARLPECPCCGARFYFVKGESK